MIILSGAPQAALADVKNDDQFHFLPLDQQSLPGHDLHPIFAEYLPAELTHQHYPNLIPEGRSVPTIANRALLVTYAWPEDSLRYKLVGKFVHEFFGKIDQFHDRARHPKWAEVNLAADIPGWIRFKPAAEWLATHQNVVMQRDQGAAANRSNAELKVAFDQFLENHYGSSGQTLSSRKQEMLFAQFMQFLQSRRSGAAR